MPTKTKKSKLKPRKIILLARSLTSLSGLLLFAAFFGYFTNYLWTENIQNSQLAKASNPLECSGLIDSNFNRSFNAKTGNAYSWNSDNSSTSLGLLNLQPGDELVGVSDNLALTKNGFLISLQNNNFKILTQLNYPDLISISDKNETSSASKYYILSSSGLVITLSVSEDFEKSEILTLNQTTLAKNLLPKIITSGFENSPIIWADNGESFNLDGSKTTLAYKIPENSKKISFQGNLRGLNQPIINSIGDVYQLDRDSLSYKIVYKIPDNICNPK